MSIYCRNSVLNDNDIVNHKQAIFMRWHSPPGPLVGTAGMRKPFLHLSGNFLNIFPIKNSDLMVLTYGAESGRQQRPVWIIRVAEQEIERATIRVSPNVKIRRKNVRCFRHVGKWVIEFPQQRAINVWMWVGLMNNQILFTLYGKTHLVYCKIRARNRFIGS